MGAHISPLPILTNLVSLKSSIISHLKNIHYPKYLLQMSYNVPKGQNVTSSERGRRLLQQSNQWNSPSFSIVTSQWQQHYNVAMLVAMASITWCIITTVILFLMLMRKMLWKFLDCRPMFLVYNLRTGIFIDASNCII